MLVGILSGSRRRLGRGWLRLMSSSSENGDDGRHLQDGFDDNGRKRQRIMRRSSRGIPDRIEEATGWIPRGAALRRYGLQDSDLQHLEFIQKSNPYMPNDNRPLRLYRQSQIFRESLLKFGSTEKIAEAAARNHRELLERMHAENLEQENQPHDNILQKLPARLGVWAKALPKTSSGKVVAAAIIGNFSISLSKFAAFAVTGSGSMLSEGIHSLADLSNQCLLAVGLSAANKTPDSLHPYGYASEKYVWALISGVGIFFLGSGVSLYHGFLGILEPTPIIHHAITPAVLTFSFAVESTTFFIALREIRKQALKLRMSTKEYIIRGPDPNTVAVLAEDSAAVIGILIAGSCIGLTYATGLAIFDSLGSVMVGSLLGVVAMFLIRKNHEFLLGRSIHSSYTDKVLEVLRDNPIISSVHDVKAVFLGPDAFRFKAEIVVDGQALSKLYLDQTPRQGSWMKKERYAINDQVLTEFGEHLIQFLGDEIDQIEADIRRAVPEIKHVDLEII